MNRGQTDVLRRCMRGPIALAAAIAIVAAPVFAAAAEPDPSGMLGYWIAESKKIAVEIYPCDDELCGKIVWLSKPYGKNGQFKRDKRNPDPTLRDRGYCGIEVITGLKPKRDDYWRNGRFYYPRKGKTFDVDLKLKDGGRLELRAYLGIRLLGMSETWSRPDPDRTLACVADPDN